MTIVDDNLIGAGPVRSAKSGTGSIKKDAEQRSAFDSAFVDAAKKKQPIVSISGKTATERPIAPSDFKAQANVTVGNADDEDHVRSDIGSRNGAADAARRLPKGLADQQGKQSKIGSQLDGFKTGEPIETDNVTTARKLFDSLKQAKAQSTANAADETSTEPTPASAEAKETGAPADVSQILSLLAASQAQPVAAPTEGQAAPSMSELELLAERAGKAKAPARDHQATEAEGERGETAQEPVGGETTETDQIFRFARADGKGQAVSMRLRAEDDGTVKAEAHQSTGGAKGEAVTVIEARRYLGLASNSNASSVTGAISGNPAWASAMQPAAAASEPLTQASTGKVLNTLKIQMHPIDLGMVTATLRLKDDELHVDLKVETGEAFRQLSDDQNEMVKALRSQGFAVDQVNIVFNASDASGRDAQQQAQSQNQGGREAAGDGAAQQGRGRRDDNGRQGGERWTGNDATGDASTSSLRGAPDDVYM